ncbi:putative hydrogenase nickel incorporation protein HypA [Shewanella sp. NFH-SH190041]|uniref:hydrogenase/urease nickel incorporation protein HypA n=1 Tax=Shewanella sp. NFH-SH190041 TaxID=2950245 RepID=UPI0021C268EF|nr:hydrogenase/urease nickel incorporation protein HypA [Shewanella sp. NFH-SH190041]BDM64079.1 putative hydrogenase nickel incorporation protein HypA [Shewanella sp. NFH-SH190041]
MHEYSIVNALLEQCDNIARENQANKVTRVAIKVGVLSGIEPGLLQTAYDTFKLDSLCSEAPLEMQIQPLVLHCHDCGKDSTPEERTVVCPQCGSFNTKVTDGEDMYLMQLELDTE